MSLDNIQLPGFVIQDLFHKSLVEIVSKENHKVNAEDTLNHFGGNKQHILLLVNESRYAFLEDSQHTFLSGILTACKLTLEDIALVNIANIANPDYKQLTDNLSSRIILMFGVTAHEIQLPFVMPEFQKQSYNNQIYIAAPSLSDLEKNKELKRKLWNVLQQVFSI